MLLAVAAQGRAHAAASRDTRVCRATAATPGIAIAESAAPSPRQRTGGRRTVHGPLREAACGARRRGLSASRQWQVEDLGADGNVRAAPVLLPRPAPLWALATQTGRSAHAAPRQLPALCHA